MNFFKVAVPLGTAFIYNYAMRSIFATLIISSSLLACSANKEIEKFADKACACADDKCATQVANDFGVWIKDNKNARGDEDKAAKDMERMMKCITDKKGDVTKLMDAIKDL